MPGQPQIAMEFITEFECKVDRYNSQQPDPILVMSGPFVKGLLQRALSTVSSLRDIANHEQVYAMTSGRLYHYPEYLRLVKSAAVLYDSQRVASRRAHMTHVNDPDPEEYLDTLAAHVTRRRLPGASMDRETWNAISPEGQSVWDTLTDEDKTRILSHAKKRTDKVIAQAHHHEISNDPDLQGTSMPPGAPEEFTVMKVKAKASPTPPKPSALRIARDEAHAGDIRRVTGTDEAVGAPTRQMNHAHLGTEQDEESTSSAEYYTPFGEDLWGGHTTRCPKTGFSLGQPFSALEWHSPLNEIKDTPVGCGVAGQPSQAPPSADNGPPRSALRVSRSSVHIGWHALVDRGANGCIARRDTRIIERTSKSIDLSGIDDHTIRNLNLVTAGAVVKSSHGNIMVIIHQAADMTTDTIRRADGVIWVPRLREITNSHETSPPYRDARGFQAPHHPP